MRSAVAFLLASILIVSLSSSALAIGSGFIENRGQIDETVRYYTLGSRMAVYFTKDAIVFDLKEAVTVDVKDPADLHPDPLKGMEPEEPAPRRGCAVYMRFQGANPSPVIEAREKLETQYNYFLGSDPSKWRTEVPAYAEVVYRDLWPGVDLILREGNGRVVYELEVAPGSEPGMARFSYGGAAGVTVHDDGSTLIETAMGTLVHKPAIPGVRDGFVEPGGAELASPPDHPSSQGRDDPSALLRSTFLGGSSEDGGTALALNSSGNPVLTGYTESADFPTTPGAYDTSHNGDYDVFVAKLSITGSTLLWSTFLGGSLGDVGTDLALDSSGNPVLTGYTQSANFPTTPGAYDASHNGEFDVFVAKLSSTGSTLLWSTFLGGSRSEDGNALALDPSGNPVLVGFTVSANFPTTPGAYDTSINGSLDVFVAKLSSTGSALLCSTLLGGAARDEALAVALDSSGSPVLTGYTESADFPTTPGAYDTSHNGDYDVFVAKLSITGSTLLWSTFLGGSSWYTDYALALDPSGNPVLTGGTNSSDFPTTPGAYDTSLEGSGDVFVAKLSSTGSTLLWSTFLGGSLWDVGTALALDSSGNPILTGYTYSADFPTTPEAYDTSHNGSGDVFVAKLSSTGSTLLWSTFLGGGSDDVGAALALDPSGSPVLTGNTSSTDFPTTPGAYDNLHNGDYDVFVTGLDLGDQTEGTRTWHILPDGSGDAPTVQAGIDSASFGDTVLVGSGDFCEHDIDLKSGVFLIGEDGSNFTIIDAHQLGRVFHCVDVDSTTKIQGFTIQNGWAELGAGVLCESSSPEITDCVFSYNTGENPLGGGIALVGSSPRLTDCVFYENGAVSGGAVYCENSDLWMSGCTVVANLALWGSGLYGKDGSVLLIENSIVAFGLGSFTEPVACATGSSASMTCSDVYGNEGGDWVGCIAGQQGAAGNFSSDPLFCAAWHYMFTLYPESPCAPENNPTCGLIGALPAGCDFTGVAGRDGVPRAYSLSSNWPNPFNPSTSIRFALPERAQVDLVLYDTAGRRVVVLATGAYDAGEHVVSWDGRDGSGRQVPSGTYFARLQAGEYSETRKMVLIH